MAVKKCRKCGEDNPPFYTHCVYCQAPLTDQPRESRNLIPYLKIALILGVSVLLVVYVLLPAVPHATDFAQNFSDTVSAPPAATVIPAYPLNTAVEDSSLRVTIQSADARGFLLDPTNKTFDVAALLEHTGTSRTIRITRASFALVDANGNTYAGYLDSPKLTIDLNPQQTRTTRIRFTVPTNAAITRVRVTFPGESVYDSNLAVADFVI